MKTTTRNRLAGGGSDWQRTLPDPVCQHGALGLAMNAAARHAHATSAPDRFRPQPRRCHHPIMDANSDADADEVLMLAYAAGDARAFERLYARHRGGLYRFLTRMTGRPAVAEELYQETWKRVIEARARYQPTAKFSTWLYQIAERLAIDAGRRHHVQREVSSERVVDGEVVTVDFADEADPATLVAEADANGRLRAAIEALPEDQRAALLLHVDGELTLEAIAELKGTGRETIKSRIRYALNKLRQQLNPRHAGGAS
jgi:RNA polymerase sigma-70 factor (ECF subfamily)